MSPGDEFELQREATTNLEREYGTEGGRGASMPMTVWLQRRKTPCFVAILEF
jgi:hypothetical protein